MRNFKSRHSNTLFLYFTVPEIAKVKAWPTYEINGFIHIWYHAEQDDPWWWPEEMSEISSRLMTYRGRTEHHINAHIEVRTQDAWIYQ